MVLSILVGDFTEALRSDSLHQEWTAHLPFDFTGWLGVGNVGKRQKDVEQ